MIASELRHPQTTMPDFPAQIFQFCQTLTQRLGHQLLKDYGCITATKKADGSLVTAADKWADQEIREAIASTFPSHGVLSEEGEHIFPAQPWCWIIDPIDGTTNFTRGLPIWGISLGLLYQGIPVFGYVHFPPLSQSFHGFSPDFPMDGIDEPHPVGAYLNNKPIHTSTDDPSPSHFLNICARSLPILQQPLKIPCKVRMLGVTTYDFLAVAMGAALAGVEATPKVWDIAAVWVILKAAGGAWVSLKYDPVFPLEVGKNYGSLSLPTLVASNQSVADKFLPLVDFLAS